MILSMNSSLAANYKSRSQMARIVSEDWGASHLYCSVCDSNQITQSPANSRAVDFVCPHCKASYQLKSRMIWNDRKILDAGYQAMMDAIRSDRTPNLLVMHYSQDWKVQNLLLVPSFFFTASSIEKRNPLRLTARRAGYVGCNILLSAIAPEGKLLLVSNGVPTDAKNVHSQYQQVRPLSQISVKLRGWVLDVLRIVSSFGKHPFSLQDVYSYEAQLAALHPNNQNIQAKIRQQLQILRDLNMLDFLGRGKYALK